MHEDDTGATDLESEKKDLETFGRLNFVAGALVLTVVIVFVIAAKIGGWM